MERGVGGAKARVPGGVDTLGSVVGDQLRGGVVRVNLDLVDGRDGGGGRGVQEDLEIPDAEVGHTNILYSSGSGELLHLSPL